MLLHLHMLHYGFLFSFISRAKSRTQILLSAHNYFTLIDCTQAVKQYRLKCQIVCFVVWSNYLIQFLTQYGRHLLCRQPLLKSINIANKGNNTSIFNAQDAVSIHSKLETHRALSGSTRSFKPCSCHVNML